MLDEATQQFAAEPNGEITLKVYHHRRLVYSTHLPPTLEIGRQRMGEPDPYCRVSSAGSERLIIAGIREATVSREHARIERLPTGNIVVTNSSHKRSISLDANKSVAPGHTCRVDLPALLNFGEKVIRLELALPMDLSSLAEPTMAPGLRNSSLMRFQDLPSSGGGHVDTAALVRWLQTTMDVLQRAASSPDFLSGAAQAVAGNVGLDTAAIVRWDGSEWHIDAQQTRPDAKLPEAWQPSQTMLQRVRAEKRTFRFTPGQHADNAASLMGVSSLVASPILNPKGEVVGAIYGDRRGGQGGQTPEITQVEALLVELIACGVAAGLAREQQEKETLAARVRFEQFFPAELAQELENDADMLSGRNADVSVLFCDICGFSRITERLGPSRAITWINDSLEALSICVMEENGVLVDYVGDELMAMWGAPKKQEDHADRACRAALRMREKLVDLNHRWQQTLGEPMDVGIGINAGMAQVGNVGSLCKFKYGPLGNTVNVASRIQGITKFLKSRLLISGSTVAKLSQEFATRKLCSVRVVNIAEPVDVHELVASAQPDWLSLKQHYESALQSFENQEFLSAARVLGNVMEQYPHDGPTLLLLSRTVRALADEPIDFDPVWELTKK